MQLIFNIHAFSVETDHNYPQLTGLVAFQWNGLHCFLLFHLFSDDLLLHIHLLPLLLQRQSCKRQWALVAVVPVPASLQTSWKKRRNQQITTNSLLIYCTKHRNKSWHGEQCSIPGQGPFLAEGIISKRISKHPACCTFHSASSFSSSLIVKVWKLKCKTKTANWRILLQQLVRMLRKQSKIFHRRPDPSPSCFSASTAARTLALKLSGGSPTITTATRRKCGKLKRDSKSCEPNRSLYIAISNKGISLPKGCLLGWGPVRPLQFDQI